MPRLLVVAGVPGELGNSFVQGLHRTLPVFAWLPLKATETYTDTYAMTLYKRVCAKLRRSEASQRDSLLAETRLIVLYVDKGDDSEATLFERFGVEALVMPFGRGAAGGRSMVTGNQRGQVANRLVRDARRAISHASDLLDEIAWELTRREVRTCLLLPRKTFGRQLDGVFEYLKDAASTRLSKEPFSAGLRRLSESMPKRREGNRSHYVNRNKMVFKSLKKAGPRHGFAPVWEDAQHELSCVMRGRLRCGVSFDPELHYDCSIPRGHSRTLPDCHGGGHRMPKGETHVNVAPNDNVR